MRSLRSASRERTSRTIQGAKISAITTAATTAARTASRAVVSESVAWRNTSPAAITSAIPIPVRDTTAARVSRPGGSAGSAVVPAAAAPAARSPSACRHSNAAPPATSTSGQTTASEIQSPSARIARRRLASSSAPPSATSTAARSPRIRSRPVESPGPAGIRSHAAPYTTKPRPPTAAATTNAIRSGSGLIQKWRASPLHTPATMRPSGSRRTARTGDAAEAIEPIFAASAGAGEPAREEDRADDGEHDRGELREVQVHGAAAVEKDRDAECDDCHARYQGWDVESLSSPHRLARRSRAGPVAHAAVGGVRVADEQRADADVRVDHHARGAGRRLRDVVRVHVHAAVAGAEQPDSAGADLGTGGDADVIGHDHPCVADAEVDVQRAVAGRQLHAAEVHHELADAELVVVAHVAQRAGAILAVAHAAVELHVRSGHERDREAERQRGQDQPAHAAPDRARD